MKSVRLNICNIVLAFAMSGCATWAQHGVVPPPDNRYKIAVLPIQASLDIDNLSDIETVPAAVAINEKELIQARLQEITAHLTLSLISRLGETPYFEIIPALPVAAATGTPVPPESWSVAELNKLSLSPGTQAVLSVKLTGYGKIKKKWLTYFIGLGVAEAVVQGVVVAKAVNTNLGIAVALEELISEVVLTGGGAHLFNLAYAPVTIEAELVSAADAKIIWEDTIFVSVDKKELEALPEEDRNKKEIQLSLTAGKAINELSENLGKIAKKNSGN